MSNDHAIFAEIEALLQPRSAAGIDQVEDTLTTGYATALQLEAERWRLERQIAEMAGDGDSAKEIAKLARRLTAADGELARLRAMLVSLRERAAEIRAAA